MVNFPQPLPWYHADLGAWVRRLRTAGELTTAIVTLTLMVAGVTFGVILGVQAWLWAVANPAIAFVFGAYIALPLGFLWVAVRLVRHAWRR